jgi:hypothetical protein
MRLLIIVIGSLLLASCIREESTETISLLTNNSTHKIKITPYSQGTAVVKDIVEINGNSSLNVLSQANRGKGAGISYASYLAFTDSVEVVFDEQLRSTHYFQNSTGANPSAIRYENARSLYNEKNYTRKIISEKKNSITNEYTFSFTEEDYQAAR